MAYITVEKLRNLLPHGAPGLTATSLQEDYIDEAIFRVHAGQNPPEEETELSRRVVRELALHKAWLDLLRRDGNVGSEDSDMGVAWAGIKKAENLLSDYRNVTNTPEDDKAENAPQTAYVSYIPW